MSRSTTKFAAVLMAATAAGGAFATSSALARHGGDDQRRPGQPPTQQQPRPQQPGAQPGVTQPGQQAPVIGVISPDQPGAARPGTRSQGPALEPGDDKASPRVGAAGDTWVTQGTRRGRSFRVNCDYVRSAVINPILFSGQNPAGHDHQFFGGLTVDESTTPASLVAANADRESTSCRQTADGSVYWQDALVNIDDPANPVTLLPDEMRVRYSAPRGQRVRAFPAGFTMIAGDRTATTLQANAGWRCEFDAPGTALQASPPVCDLDEAIVGVVRFPNCWDGTTLTSATLPQPHVAFRTGSTCPTTHPVALPELVEEVFWPSDGEAHTYKISGADTTTGIHAAFINGWDQRALRNQVRRWLNRRA